MSSSYYREMRSFVEMMKALRYPHFISLNSFMQPNFALMIDALLWLFLRFDPDAKVDTATDTPQQRVTLIKTLADSLLLKAGIKVNLRNLYAADIYAVRELLRLALLLYKANSQDADALPQVDDVVDMTAPLCAVDLHNTRRVASEIAHAGANLHDRLVAEGSLGDMRERALAVNMDVEGAEASIKEALASAQEALRMLQGSTAEIQREAKLTQERLVRKRAELDHHSKRLATLAAVRPPHMAEQEALQGQLQELYLEYASRFRNLQYLRAELDLRRDAEREAMAEADKHRRRLLRRLKQEELRILRGEGGEGDDSDMDSGSSEDDAPETQGTPDKRRGSGASQVSVAKSTMSRDVSIKQPSRISSMSRGSPEPARRDSAASSASTAMPMRSASLFVAEPRSLARPLSRGGQAFGQLNGDEDDDEEDGSSNDIEVEQDVEQEGSIPEDGDDGKF